MKSNRIPEDIKDSYCQICMEYTVYIRECIRDAMEAEYGDRAFEVLKAIDRARVSALRSSGQAALPTVPQNSGIDSFEQLDLYACTKMLWLPKNNCLALWKIHVYTRKANCLFHPSLLGERRRLFMCSTNCIMTGVCLKLSVLWTLLWQ